MDDFIIRRGPCKPDACSSRDAALKHSTLGHPLNQHYFNQHLNRQRQRYEMKKKSHDASGNSSDYDSHSSCSSEALETGDLLATNPLCGQPEPGPSTRPDIQPPPGRYFKNISNYITLDSRCRLACDITQVRQVLVKTQPTQYEICNAKSKSTPSATPTTCKENDNENENEECRPLHSSYQKIKSAVTTSGLPVTVIRSGGGTSSISKRTLRKLTKKQKQHHQHQPKYKTLKLEGESENDGESENNSESENDCESDVSSCYSDEVKQTIAANILLTQADQLDFKPVERPKTCFNRGLCGDRPFDTLGFESTLESVANKCLQGQGLTVGCEEPLSLAIERDPRVYGNSNIERLRFNNTREVGGLADNGTVAFTTRATVEGSGHYLFHLDRRYQNVKLIRLVTSIIPEYQHLINLHNHQITFMLQDDQDIILNRDDSTKWNCHLPIGNWTPVELAEILTEELNQTVSDYFNKRGDEGDTDTQSEDSLFRVTVDLRRRKFKISIREPYSFRLSFNQTLAKSMGLSDSSTGLGLFTDSLESREPFNFYQNRTLNIKLIGWDQYQVNPIYDCFTKEYYFNQIAVDKYRDGYCYNSHLDVESVIDNADLSFEYLELAIVDCNGAPVEFDHHIHAFQLTFEIIEYSDRLVGQNLNTRRGVTDYS